jgi:hypothetical protein
MLPSDPSPPPAPAAVNLMYEVFPAQDRYVCWQDEVHGGSGPTLEAARQPRQPAGDEAREEGDTGVSTGEGDPVSQQRRRLSAAAGGVGADAAGPYLFDWEKKPAKLLSFVRLAEGLLKASAYPPPCMLAPHACNSPAWYLSLSICCRATLAPPPPL